MNKSCCCGAVWCDVVQGLEGAALEARIDALLQEQLGHLGARLVGMIGGITSKS